MQQTPVLTITGRPLRVPGKEGEFQQSWQTQEDLDRIGANVVDSISRVGEGLSSCLQVVELQYFTSIESLCLHGNNIRRIEGLEHLKYLTNLNLSNNAISGIENLSGLSSLVTLDLSRNRLQVVQGLAPLCQLQSLDLSYNTISDISGLSELHGPQYSLQTINLAHNIIASLQNFAVLVGCQKLQRLSVAGNPACINPGSFKVLRSAFPQDVDLDEEAAAHHSSSLQVAQQTAANKLLEWEAQSSHHPPWKRPIRESGQRKALEVGPGRTGRPMRPISVKQVIRTLTGPVDDQLEFLQGEAPSTGSDTSHPPSRDQRSARSYLEATTQTSDSAPLLQELKTENDELKHRLSQLADVLEKKEAKMAEVKQQSDQAVKVANEEARRRVDESYQEASYAVSKALQQVETARKAAAEATGRAAHLEKLADESKHKNTSLEKDVEHLRQQLSQSMSQLQHYQQSGGKALQEERTSFARSEVALKQEIQQLATELAVQQAGRRTAEQQISTLEAALQKSSEVTVSMTEKMAQAVSDTNQQLDQFKSRLVATEQQLGEWQRREAASRAEVSLLTTTLATTQEKHQQEVKLMKEVHQEEMDKALARATGDASDRARSTALAEAQQEKTTLREQLTFLKTQLQYALQESDREVHSLQDQLSSHQEEVAWLKEALQRGTVQQQEKEALIRDLSKVVQQQKNHMQALVSHKDKLLAQLQSCAPEEYDKLRAENQALRRQITDLEFIKEEAEQHKTMRKEADRKLGEREVDHTRVLDESNRKITGLEASLKQIREELQVTGQKLEALEARATTAEDTVKIKTAMVDSANSTVLDLKAEVMDLQQELEETKRVAEEAEAQLRSVQDQDNIEKSSLRSEIAAAEAALEQMERALALANGRVKEAEQKYEDLKVAVAEKDNLLKYVEEEVDRVKELFSTKEAALRKERDTALHDLEAAVTARDQAEQQLAEVQASMSEVQSRLDGALADLEVERRNARNAVDAAARAEADASKFGNRVMEVENEMRQLLAAVEQQKAQSAAKMRQLASILHDM